MISTLIKYHEADLEMIRGCFCSIIPNVGPVLCDKEFSGTQKIIFSALLPVKHFNPAHSQHFHIKSKTSIFT